MPLQRIFTTNFWDVFGAQNLNRAIYISTRLNISAFIFSLLKGNNYLINFVQHMVESVNLNTKKMTLEKFFLLIQNCRGLYEGVLRNGCYLQKIKSTMITEDYVRK